MEGHPDVSSWKLDGFRCPWCDNCRGIEPLSAEAERGILAVLTLYCPRCPATWEERV